MKAPALALAAVLAALTGCDFDGVPAEAQLLVPDDVALHWEPAFNEVDDGIGALVPIDLMVYHATTGEPLEGVAIVLRSAPAWGAAVLPPDAILYGADVCDDCAGAPFALPTWDAYRDEYFEVDLVDSVAPSRGSSLPGEVRLVTDVNGLAPAYVFVDTFPSSPAGGFEPVDVQVAMEHDTAEHTFALVPR